MPKLEELNLSGNALNTDSLNKISKVLKFLPNLKKLNFQSCNILGIKQFTDKFSCITKLESLNLNNNDFKKKGMNYLLTSLSRLPKLNTLLIERIYIYFHYIL